MRKGVTVTWKLDERGFEELASGQRFKAVLHQIGDQIEEGTREKAKWSGYSKQRHWHEREVVGAEGGAAVEVATSYSFAHLDEFGGAMYVGPTRPMRRTLDEMGLEGKNL